MLRAATYPYVLKFKERAITSRDVMTVKDTFIIEVWDSEFPEISGKGEVALFKGLSQEDNDDFVKCLDHYCRSIDVYYSDILASLNKTQKSLTKIPSSILFGFETALKNLEYNRMSNLSGSIVFPSSFTSGDKEIAINGLVWMGDFHAMKKGIEKKIDEGFNVIKLKIGGIDIEKEIELVRFIREQNKQLSIRLDANCSFSKYNLKDALEILEQLSKWEIHSLEQPFLPVHTEYSKIASESGFIPIALDEQLIGVKSTEEKSEILEMISPQYIVLKPSLCGGFAHSREWIEIATNMGIDWWITSALESSVGLNAIAQFAAKMLEIYPTDLPQGLGTGELYTNNFKSPLQRKGQYLSFVG